MAENRHLLRDSAPVVFLLAGIFIVLIGSIGIGIGEKNSEAKQFGIMFKTDKVLTSEEIDEICDVIERDGWRKVTEIRVVFGDQVQYRIRFKKAKKAGESITGIF